MSFKCKGNNRQTSSDGTMKYFTIKSYQLISELQLKNKQTHPAWRRYDKTLTSEYGIHLNIELKLNNYENTIIEHSTYVRNAENIKIIM